MKTDKFKKIKYCIKHFFISGIAALFINANAQAFLILDVNIGGGASEFTSVVFDGEETYTSTSNIGGWSLVFAAAGAEPDYAGGIPEIHLSLVANCLSSSGCDTLNVLAASDYPVDASRIGLALGTVPSANATSSAHLFTGFNSGDLTNPIVTQTDVLGPWTSSFTSSAPMIGSSLDTLWGLSATINATGAGFSSLDFKVAVPEPGTIILLGLGLVALGTTRRKRLHK